MREARREDLPWLCRLTAQLGHQSTTLDQLSSRFERAARFPGCALFVAEEGDTVVGWLQLHTVFVVVEDPYVEIGGLVVDELTRGKEIRGILAALDEAIPREDSTPLVVGGDFNSPSHLDWSEASRDEHDGLTVEWPVSREMAAAGFIDAFRTVHPDSAQVKGRTWSPRFVEPWQFRIDYVYLRGPGIRPIAARMIDQVAPHWPSDHAAVLTTLELPRE